MRYYPVIESAPYCCWAASLESILKRHGYNHVSQYVIANYLGLVVFESDRNDMPKTLTNISYTTDPKKVGLHIYDDTLPNLFHQFNLPFKEKYIGWQYISDWNFEDILNGINPDYDVMIYFDFGRLYHEEKNYGVGHTGLFVSMDKSSKIELLNPGPRFLGLNNFASDDIVDAIRAREGGISIIYKG